MLKETCIQLDSYTKSTNVASECLLFWDQDSWLAFDQHTNMTSCKVVKSNSNNFYIDSDKCLTLLFSLFPFYGTCIGAT